MTSRKISLSFLSVLCLLGVAIHLNAETKPLKVRSIYPSGTEVSIEARIAIEFNQGVALSSIYENFPIDIEPALDCEWNWIKLNTLRCELPTDSDLEQSTQYTVTVRPEFKASNGALLSQEYVHTFSTPLPAITRTQLIAWLSPTQPIITVTFNQDVKLNTLLDRITFTDAKNESREVPTQVWLYDYKYTHQLSRKKYLETAELGKEYSHLEIDTNSSLGDRRVLVLPKQDLAPDSSISISLLPGIEGASGNLATQERVRVNTDIETLPDFRFMGITCKNVFNRVILMSTEQPSDEQCKGSASVRLDFSSKFQTQDIGVRIYARPKGVTAVELENSAPAGWSRSWEKDWSSPIIENLQFNARYRIEVFKKQGPNDEDNSSHLIRDQFGRSLTGPKIIEFHTSPPEPDTRVHRRHAVVDSLGTADPQIQTLNVDEVSVSFDSLDEQGHQRNQKRNLRSSTRDHVTEVQPLNLRDNLRSSSGIMTGLVHSRPRFTHPTEQLETTFFVQATPYSVFLNIGTKRSFTWIVDLQTGEPVADANVHFYLGTPSDLSEIRETIHEGKTDANGVLHLPGYEQFEPRRERATYTGNDEGTTYFLRVDGESGFALLPVQREYRMSKHNAVGLSSVDHWATTAQGLYQPGETVHIKGYLRSWNDELSEFDVSENATLDIKVPSSDDPYPRAYEVSYPHYGEGIVIPIVVSRFGSYDASFTLSESAPVGEYWIFTAGELGGTFRVVESTNDRFRVSHSLDSASYEPGDRMTVTTTAKLLEGKPYVEAKGNVKVEFQNESKPWHFPFQSVSRRDYFLSWFGGDGRELLDVHIELDGHGTHTQSLDIPNLGDHYSNVLVESVIRSDNGHSRIYQSYVPYFGVDRFVAIRRPVRDQYGTNENQVIRVGKPWPIEVLVVSKEDRIDVGRKVRIKVFEYQSDVDVSQKELTSEIPLKEVFNCELVSASTPVSCNFTPLLSKHYKVVAEISDTKGRVHRSSLQVTSLNNPSVPRSYYVKANQPVQLFLDCNARNVSVGDIVRCEIKNFLTNAPTLVTVEHTSGLKEWLVRLSADAPYIEFRVEEEFAPRFRLSVLNWAPTGLDSVTDDTLYRTGTRAFEVARTRLKNPLRISLATNQEAYGPRDKVELTITNVQSSKSRVPIEYAIAVVDETLLELMQPGDFSSYFDPTQKTWTIDPDRVDTYGVIAALLKKSDLVSPENLLDYSSLVESDTGELGPSEDVKYDYFFITHINYGSGLSPAIRQLSLDPYFRAVAGNIAYWNPSVISEHQEHTLEFELPDRLTRWKVIVLAVSADHRFGYAQTTVSSVTDMLLQPLAPNIVTEGDTFYVGATIQNSTEHERQISIEFEISGLVSVQSKTSFVSEEEFGPFEHKTLSWEIEAGNLPFPQDLRDPIAPSEIKLVAIAGDYLNHEELEILIPVRSGRVRVSNVTRGVIDEDQTVIPVVVPMEAHDDVAQLNLTLNTSNTVNFDGVFRGTSAEPYSSWEHELTHAVLAMQYLNLENQGAQHHFYWEDPRATIELMFAAAKEYQGDNFFPNQRRHWANRQDYDYGSIYLTAYTLLVYSWLEQAGYEAPALDKQRIVRSLRSYIDDLRIQLKEDDPKDDWRSRTIASIARLTEGRNESEQTQRDLHRLTATRTAVAMHALALSKELTHSDLEIFEYQLDQMDLFGLSQYLLAVLQLDPSHQLVGTVVGKIMDHRTSVDGTIKFVESVPYGFIEIFHSEARSLCSVLTALTEYSKSSLHEFDVEVLNQLSNIIRDKRNNSRGWQNSQANVFCTNALISYLDYVDEDTSDATLRVNLHSEEPEFNTQLVRRWKLTSKNPQFHTSFPIQVQSLGPQSTLKLRRRGNGTAFYEVELSYLAGENEKTSGVSGLEVHREYLVHRKNGWYFLEPEDHLYLNEQVVVSLYVNNRYSRHHVVLEDSVPGGLEPVNLGAGTEPKLLSQTEGLFHYLFELGGNRIEDINLHHYESFQYREVGLDSVRFFTTALPRGKSHFAWLGRAAWAGKFSARPARVEEMYRPRMFGISKPMTLTVKP